MKYATEEAFVGANAFGKGAINDAAFLTKVVLQCLPYIGYSPSLNAMGCIAKAAKQ